MTGTARHYFARGNTAHGVHFLYGSAFQGLTKLFVLLGSPGTGKSTTIRRLSEMMMNQGWDVELFHSPLNPDELDGLIITELKTGIADGSVCEHLPSEKDMETVPIDFDEAVDPSLLSEQNLRTIAGLKGQLAEAYGKAYGSFAEALRVHDEWEKFYIDSMDFGKADQLAQELADTLFGSESRHKKATVRHLFFGAATPRGAVDHIQNITAGLKTRIFIKGRAGSGKSTLLKRLAAAAEEQGLDVEVFHCGFDPNSLDMLIFPELHLAIFDSTAPHEYFPDRSGDRILDMYERVIRPGVDERYSVELDAIKLRYSQNMKEATSYLAEARSIDSRMKAFYTAATDFSRVNHLRSELQCAVDELSEPAIINNPV